MSCANLASFASNGVSRSRTQRDSLEARSSAKHRAEILLATVRTRESENAARRGRGADKKCIQADVSGSFYLSDAFFEQLTESVENKTLTSSRPAIAVETTLSQLGWFNLSKTTLAGHPAESHASMPVQETQGADMGGAETWDSRISKLLSLTKASESERTLTGEVDTVVDRVKPFFGITELPSRERKTHVEAPNTATQAVHERPTEVTKPEVTSRDIHVDILSLCQLEPHAVKRFLQEAQVGYHLKRSLFYCRYYGVFEAEALILEKMGQASKALSVCINAYSVNLKDEQVRLTESPASKMFKSRADDIIVSAVGVCFHESSNATENTCLWTKLLSSLTVHLRCSTEGLVRALVESHICAVLRAASTLVSDVVGRLIMDGVMRESFENHEAALQDFRLSLSKILALIRVKVNIGEKRAEARERAAGVACRERAARGKCKKLSS